ncbi:MAG: hypothetical protein ACK41T_08945 [Pseudobdellovibrio sp.]
MKNAILLLTLSFLFFSCTTRYKKAQNLMADENYDEALTILQGLVSEDPKDPDYAVALKQAREGVLSKSLIRVRMTRLANNNIESLELLRTVFEQQNDWKLFPTGAVAFTQNEEVIEAHKTIQKEIAALESKKQYLRVLYVHERYKILFTENQKKSLAQSYKNAMGEGRKFCLTKSKTTQTSTHYYNILIQKWCDFVDQKTSIAKSNSPLFKDISIKNESLTSRSSLPDSLNAFITSQLNKGKTKVYWIGPQTEKTLNLYVSGFYQLNENRYREYRVHNYEEDIPITEYVTQTETDPKTLQTITKSIPQTKYIKKPRVYPYYVNITLQSLNSALTLLKYSNLIPETTFDYKQETKSTSHSYNLPNIGLRPLTEGRQYTSDEWQAMTSEHYTQNIIEHLNKAYKSYYCEQLDERKAKTQFIDQALLCLRSAYSSSTSINQIFLNEYQMTPAEMSNLFSVVD